MLQVLNSHMKATVRTGFRPRKKPRQARARATVEAIFDATVQVLSEQGLSQLTTTRAAERAGVSVGTMYQYFPNKQSLLYSLLERHLDEVATAVEAAAAALTGKPIDAISNGLTARFLEVKTGNMDVSRALYAVYAELNAVAVLDDVSQRINRAILACLKSASDARFEKPGAVAFAFQATLAGATRSVLERELNAIALKQLRAELPKVCRSYLRASADIARPYRPDGDG